MQRRYLLQHGPLIGCRKIPAQPWPLPQVAEESLLWPWSMPSPSFFDAGAHTAASHWFSSFLFGWHFFPPFKCVFTKTPLALLIGLTMSSGRSIEELAGTVCVQHGPIPGLIPQRPSLQSHHLPSDISDKYFMQSKNHNKQSSYAFS